MSVHTPWRLQQVLLYIIENYGNPPIYISHITTPQSLSLEDSRKNKYLSSHTEAMLHSLGFNIPKHERIKLKKWSLMDLYDLLEGYKMSYGLYYVDFKVLFLRDTLNFAHWYQEITSPSLACFNIYSIKREVMT
ncbi:hypothetical protein HID58_069413 [Brassica napus]|uniref:thioglucosidase n=1 Tax=Brassica napus TaxID=3708 RepID=A0ABQ7XDF0_BRANA|nr:hypothetical protein HID58_092728 [Brassica napus]KAH0872051.1 hypothetical protein HID58_069413 [Brassica napus]